MDSGRERRAGVPVRARRRHARRSREAVRPRLSRKGRGRQIDRPSHASAMRAAGRDSAGATGLCTARERDSLGRYASTHVAGVNRQRHPHVRQARRPRRLRRRPRSVGPAGRRRRAWQGGRLEDRRRSARQRSAHLQSRVEGEVQGLQDRDRVQAGREPEQRTLSARSL